MARIHIPHKRIIDIRRFHPLVMAAACELLWLVILIPLHYWMIRRGHKIPSDQISDGAQNLSRPTLRSSWPALLATLGIMIAALVATISQIA